MAVGRHEIGSTSLANRRRGEHVVLCDRAETTNVLFGGLSSGWVTTCEDEHV